MPPLIRFHFADSFIYADTLRFHFGFHTLRRYCRQQEVLRRRRFRHCTC